MYAVSFGIGAMAVTTGIFILYTVGLFIVRRRLPVMNFRATFVPALLTGLFWNIGNVGSIYATLSPLGLTVGALVSLNLFAFFP